VLASLIFESPATYDRHAHNERMFGTTRRIFGCRDMGTEQKVGMLCRIVEPVEPAEDRPGRITGQ